MANKKIQIFAWLILALITLGGGVMTLTIYKRSTLSMFAGAMQILASVFLLIVIYIYGKKKENSNS